MLGVSCIITGHREKNIILPSLKSALNNLQQLKKIGVAGEINLVLDNPDPMTLDSCLKFRNLVNLHLVDFWDPSQSRNFAISVSNYDYVAFLDGDDLWGLNWLSNAWNFQQNLPGEYAVLHPKFNYYFSNHPKDLHARLTEQISSIDDRYDQDRLAGVNYWTALSFGHRSIFEKVPFTKNDSELGIGFEDWTFNIATVHAGYRHLIVDKTIHFIREKINDSVSANHSAEDATFIPHDIWFTN